MTGGELLRRYRSAAGLTQEELAARAGYSANYIGKLESDQRNLPAAAAGHLAAVLGLADSERATLLAARGRGDALAAPVTPARPLAGRDPEMAQIRQLLTGTGPPVLLLTGEPGIGKTRLLEEAAAGAADCGWHVGQSGCLRWGQDAYAPLSSALAGALAGLPTKNRAGVLARAGRVDLLLPELGPPRESLTPANVEPERQRRLLVSSAMEVVRAVAGPAGTLLVLDDVHWAGPDAIGLLAALLAAGTTPAVRVIGAYRNSEVTAWLSEFIADLARASLVRMVELGPLTDPEATRLLTGLTSDADQDADQESVRAAIVRRAGGVPFFLVSYAEQVHDQGLSTGPLAVLTT